MPFVRSLLPMTNTMKLVCCVIFFISFSQLIKSSTCNEVGSVVKVGDLISYVSGSPQSKHAVIIGSDVFGYTTPNIRLIADKVAEAGFYAVVPDFFRGDPFDPLNPKKPKEVWRNLHPPAKSVEDSKPIISALEKQGISGIGFAGFCWGGKVAAELAKTNSIKAAVLLHPSFVTVNDTSEVDVPMAILGAQFDTNLPVSLIQEFEKSLKSNNKVKASQVKVFPNVRHGFALKYNLTDSTAVKVANEAHKDMIDWFIEYVN